MASINTMAGSGTALPTAQALFEQARSAPTSTSSTPTGSSAPVGTGAYQSTDPAVLDQPDATYPALVTSHVAVLRAIGTPEAILQQLNAQQPSKDFLDQYIQSEIMQNPEGWDEFVGNPRGTARAGLLKLVPGLQLPAPGQGRPGTPIGGSTTGETSTTEASGSHTEGVIKGVVIAAAVAGAGLLAWHFLKKRGGGGAEAKQAAELVQNAIASGGGIDTRVLATLESIKNGHGVTNGFLQSVGNSALRLNLPMDKAVKWALADHQLDVLKEFAKQGGSFADLAAAGAASAGATGVAGAGKLGASQLASVKSLLTAALNALT